MAPSISVRVYIRWLPDPSSEPTQTIVLTSAENRFVDIRILKAESPSDDEGFHEHILPFSRLDWAFAGTSSSDLIKQPNGEQRVHSKWTHWVDSRSFNPEEEINDEGDMIPQGKGITLERGSMINPATGQMTQYEESWKDIAPKPIRDKDRSTKMCVVLRLHDDEHKARGMVVRVGQYCQGFVRVGEKMALERWAWTEAGKWQRLTRMGDLFLPCAPAIENNRLKLGGEVMFGEYVWKVVELSDF